jgi:hypothetical protein
MTHKRKRVVPFKHRKLSEAEKNRWNSAAQKLLDHCDEIFRLSRGFDTAVSDSVANGLAPLVHAAFDCRAIALDFKDLESSSSFITNSTAEWFRSRGFVEWFAAGAAMLFNTTPPRRFEVRTVVVKRKTA